MKKNNLPSSKDCINELKKLQEEFPNKKITRDFFVKSTIVSNRRIRDLFGSFNQLQKVAGLKYNKHQLKVLNQTTKQAEADICREYFKKEILPYHLKYEKDHKNDLITIMVCSDLHDKEVDEFALSVFLNECYRIQPDIIILNGDIFDLYEFSRYTKDPRKCDVVGRIKFVHDRVFSKLREACPKAQIDFIVGNHEYRLLTMLANTNPHLQVLLADLHGMGMEKLLGLDRFKINLFAKIDLGGYNTKDIDSELRKNFKVYFDCFVATHKPTNFHKFGMSGTNGHHHKGEISSFTTHLLGQCTWLQTPALHLPDAEYLEELPQWNMGYAEYTISQKHKEVHAQLRFIGKTFAKIDGQIYRRK